MERRKLGLLAVAGVAALALMAVLATGALAQGPSPRGAFGPAASCPGLEGGTFACPRQNQAGTCPMLDDDDDEANADCPGLQGGYENCPAFGGNEGVCPGVDGRDWDGGMGPGMMRGFLGRMGGYLRGGVPGRGMMGQGIAPQGSCPMHRSGTTAGTTL